MTICWGSDQYTMERDFYLLALFEFKKANPHMRREADYSQADRQRILNRARELKLAHSDR